MNAYTIQFAGRCPTNGVRINYTLRIETREVLPVEQIVAAVEAIEAGEDAYHEEIADRLATQFPGKHTMTAMHHGVLIETVRLTAPHHESADTGPHGSNKPDPESEPDFSAAALRQKGSDAPRQ